MGTRLKWEEPPHGVGGNHNSNNGPHKPISDGLRRRPGEWAHVLTYTTARTSGSMAMIIRSGTTRAWAPKGAFEATANKVDGEYRVYARFVGGGDG